MVRPRIRTLKPELWQDESVGSLSHGARLLFIGLITMADDDGRLRELLPLINGSVFPHDNLPPAKVARWLREVEATQMICRYSANGTRYIAFRRWAKHQRVDRKSASELPPPPDQFDERSTKPQRENGEQSSGALRGLDEDAKPPAQARVPIRSDPFLSSNVQTQHQHPSSSALDAGVRDAR